MVSDTVGTPVRALRISKSDAKSKIQSYHISDDKTPQSPCRLYDEPDGHERSLADKLRRLTINWTVCGRGGGTG
jgi:hypothetical protein